MMGFLFAGLTGCHGRAASGSVQPETGLTYDHGGIVRGPINAKRLALIFTGGEHGEGATTILDALAERGVKASFFVTGDFIRQEQHQAVLRRIVAEGHYLGPHSDSHPLYCPWEDRTRTLITRAEFRADLERNLADLARYSRIGTRRGSGGRLNEQNLADPQCCGRRTHQIRFFIPPYEWYNEDIVAWAAEMDLVLFNFTLGTRSNADYAPDDHRSFLPSEKIYRSILDFEGSQPHGLNGFLLLLHLGAGPGRTDKMHPYVGPLIDELRRHGYAFVRVDELLSDHS